MHIGVYIPEHTDLRTAIGEYIREWCTIEYIHSLKEIYHPTHNALVLGTEHAGIEKVLTQLAKKQCPLPLLLVGRGGMTPAGDFTFPDHFWKEIVLPLKLPAAFAFATFNRHNPNGYFREEDIAAFLTSIGVP